MRIVLDTNILVRAHAKATGPARELLLLTIRAPEHVLLVSPFLLRELERVLSYERVRRVTRLTDDEAAEFLFYLGRPGISENDLSGSSSARGSSRRGRRPNRSYGSRG